jgi:hypothetical protein
MLVPPSLNRYPETATPLYLVLTQQDTSVLNGGEGKWRNIRLSEITGNQYVLPAPKVGLGLGTHSANLDEAKFWQTSSVGDKARMVFGDTIFYAMGGLLNDVGYDTETGRAAGYIAGGANIPKDLSAIQYKGMKKRAYSFSFELFAFTNADFNVITQFCRNMHSHCMPAVLNNGTLSTPSVFRIQIMNSGFTDVTNNWLFQPQPCTMTAFNSSALDYISIDGNNTSPARVGVNMVLAEIEPVVNVGGNVATTAEVFGV